jgi:hypothetical protein
LSHLLDRLQVQQRPQDRIAGGEKNGALLGGCENVFAEAPRDGIMALIDS